MSQDDNNTNNKYLPRSTATTFPNNNNNNTSDCRLQLELKSLLDLETIRNPLSGLLRRNYSSE